MVLVSRAPMSAPSSISSRPASTAASALVTMRPDAAPGDAGRPVVKTVCSPPGSKRACMNADSSAAGIRKMASATVVSVPGPVSATQSLVSAAPARAGTQRRLVIVSGLFHECISGFADTFADARPHVERLGFGTELIMVGGLSGIEQNAAEIRDAIAAGDLTLGEEPEEMLEAATVDGAGNLYFTHHFYGDGPIEADIYVVQMSSFKLQAEADFLQNYDDDHTLSVFDPAIRGKTDRFVLRYVRN